MSENDVARLQEQVKTLFNEVGELKTSIEKVEGKIDRIRDDLSKRLPAWATALIALLTALVGWLAK